MKLLLVTRDAKLVDELGALREAGHELVHCTSVTDGAAAMLDRAELLLIDERAMGSVPIGNVAAPVVGIADGGDPEDVARVLDAGADDCVIRPVALVELAARMRAAVRRVENALAAATVTCGSIKIDRIDRRVWRHERPVTLQAREFRLLEELALARGHLVSREQLLTRIWNLNFDPSTKVVETHISHLRSKLTGQDEPDPIETVRGEGYRLRTYV